MPGLYKAINEVLPKASLRGWAGVNQMHQARNVAQHAGVAPDVAQMANWSVAAITLIDTLCTAAFGVALTEILLSDAVHDQDLRTRLGWSEEALASDPGQSLALALGTLDEARERWRAQRAEILFPAPPTFDPDEESAPPPRPLQEVDEFLEMQPFAGDIGEYTWLRRARIELETVGWIPSEAEARRALIFVTGWIVRWEIFDRGYPADRWDAHREGIEPQHTDGGTLEILGGQVELLPDLPGRPGRYRIVVQLANVPGRGRAPWENALNDAFRECALEAGIGPELTAVDWYLNGMLVVRVTPGASPDAVIDVIEKAVALAGSRYAAASARTADQAAARERLQTDLRELVRSASSNDARLFDDASVVDDRWLGTFGWLALLKLRQPEGTFLDLSHLVARFSDKRADFPNVHVRDGQLAFSISAISSDFESALRGAIADSEELARHRRKIRTEQASAFQSFANGFQTRIPPLPEP